MADIITLKQICSELKLDPREARERLRTAARDAKKHPELAKTHRARAPWTWVKGSPDEKAARIVVASNSAVIPSAATAAATRKSEATKKQ